MAIEDWKREEELGVLAEFRARRIGGAEELTFLAGEAQRLEDALVAGDVEQARLKVDSLLSTFKIPYARVVIRDDFWQTDLGYLIAKARLMIHAEDTMTIMDAATDLGISLPVMSTAASVGEWREWPLTVLINPDASKNQGRRLLLWSEIQMIRATIMEQCKAEF